MKTTALSFFLLACVVSFANAQQRVYINENGECSNNPNQEVTLQIEAAGIKEMMISNASSFIGAKWEPFKPNKNWKLTATEGRQSVYVKLKDSKGTETTVTDDILFDTQAPIPGLVRINNGATETKYPDVTLGFDAKGADYMWISNSPKFEDGTTWELYSKNKEWTMGGIEGKFNVYVKFKDACGNESKVVSGRITIFK